MVRKIKLGGAEREIIILSADYSKYNATELFNLSGNPKRYKEENGVWRFFNQAELEAEKLERNVRHATEEAEQLYKELKARRIVTVDGVEYDISDLFLFDKQRGRGGDVMVKLNKGKVISMTKAETDDIETALDDYLSSLAVAFNADMDAIEAGDYSNSNLKGI